MVDIFTAKIFLPGMVLFLEGTNADCAFLVESGSLEVLRHVDGSEVRVAILGAGEIVGEMGLLEGGVRTATVRCLTKSVCLQVTPAIFNRLMEDNNPFIRAMLLKLQRRLREQTGLVANALNAPAPAPAASKGDPAGPQRAMKKS